MEHVMDPYEQQLLSVFNSYDVSHKGSLDRHSLQQLCNSLQLEDRGVELVKCLVSDTKSCATFNEFKEGLLALLGNVQSSRQKLDFDGGEDDETESPDREISPKFVYGSKKYGRRSRPESTELELFEASDEDLDLEEEKNSEVFLEKCKPAKSVKVQRSSSQSDVTHSRKRKTAGKLKRCTSFPGNHEMAEHFKPWSSQDKKIQSTSEENYCATLLQSALQQLAIGADGFLTHLEVIRVCEFMNLHEIAKDLLLVQDGGDFNKKVSVEDFAELLQQRNDNYDMESSHLSSVNSTLNNITENFGNKSLQYLSMGPNGSGLISSQAIVELWESAGISSGSNLLNELGFTENMISIIDLATIIDEELRSITDIRTDNNYTSLTPHIVLLQASIALYQSEVKYLKSVLEHVSAERDKLRSDIVDANHRATLLAQEIDDNHLKMEQSSQNQVKLLEQRHTDILKDLTSQFIGEKENMGQLNNKLDEKIFILETEEAKLRSDLLGIQSYNTVLEKENSSLVNQLSELKLERNNLSDKVTILSTECQKICEFERERSEIEPLVKKLSVLQLENAELRDKNDELCTEVESLNLQMSALRSKVSLNVGGVECENSALADSLSVGFSLGAIKRRVESPNKENSFCVDSESPRLGKVRRCYNKNQPEPGEVLLDILGSQPLCNSSESGFEADLDCCDSSSFNESETHDEITALQARIACLEQLLKQNHFKSSAPIAINNIKQVDANLTLDLDKLQLQKRCKELEQILEEVHVTVVNMKCKKSDCKNNCNQCNPVSIISDKLKEFAFESTSDESLGSTATTVISVDYKPLKVDSYTETDNSCIEMNNIIDEKMNLVQRCEELEQALDLLRNEYDHCENYWANKLDDERQLYEQEHEQSNEKLKELLIKISEYETQFGSQQSDVLDGRLSPINETQLETQFTELEEEYDSFRSTMEQKIKQQDKQICELKLKLNYKPNCDIGLQVELPEIIHEHGDNKLSNLSNVVVSTNIFSSETIPQGWQYPSSIDSPSIDPPSITPLPSSITQEISVNDSLCSCSSEENNSASLPPNIWQQPALSTASSPPHSLNYLPEHTANHFPVGACRPKTKRNARKHDRSIFTVPQCRLQKKEHDMILHRHSEMMEGGDRWFNGHLNDQSCLVPVNSIHHLHGRLRALDQHCRHLQFILKQQQRHSEGVMHHCWQQHREEINELQIQMKTLHEKLARSDMLIKDLYVENTYLIANNQRLEHRCHMLVQCSSESTSV